MGLAEGISTVEGGLPAMPSSQGLWLCSVSDALQKEVRLPLAVAARLVGNEQVVFNVEHSDQAQRKSGYR